jgi:hypothetical protein
MDCYLSTSKKWSEQAGWYRGPSEEPISIDDSAPNSQLPHLDVPEQDSLHDKGDVCPVCFDLYTHDGNENKEAIPVDLCGHMFCRECLIDYCKYHISLHRIPIPCPSSVSVDCGDDPEVSIGGIFYSSSRAQHKTSGSLYPSQRQIGCREVFTLQLVESLLKPHPNHKETAEGRVPGEMWIKYQSLCRLSSDTSLTPCTRCDELVSPSDCDSSSSRRCPACRHVFCTIHGDGHLGKSCEEAANAGTQQNIGTIMLGDDTKACSHCGTALHKFSGCDHVVCPACHEDMCFRCGTHRHLTGKMTRYCSKCRQGYLDHRYIWWIRLMYCVYVPFFIVPTLILYTVTMIVLVVLSGCCLGFFAGGILLNDERRWTPRRGVLTVGCILVLPAILLLVDLGNQWPWLLEFMEWFFEGGRDVRTIQETPSSLSSMEKGRGNM